MAHGLDPVETASAAAPPAGAVGSIERVVSLLNQFIVLIASIALVAASLVLTYSVIVRYFLKISTDWQDEMSVFLIIGAVFMSSAAIQARRGHVAIEAVSSLLSPHVNRVRLIVVDILSFAFCAFFALKAWTLLQEAIVDNFHSGSTWGPPLWVPYSLMTAGMTLLSLQLLLQIARAFLRPKVPA
jgi:TRAP-type C4-dicarboxylate transport system permease small subunit